MKVDVRFVEEYIEIAKKYIKLKTWKLTADEEKIEMLFDVIYFETTVIPTNSDVGGEYALVFGFKENSANVRFMTCCFEKFENYKVAYDFVKKSIENSNFTLDICGSERFKEYSLIYW